ncbi:hypothetical protein MASR1M32_10270 [Rhodobacter sp.]
MAVTATPAVPPAQLRGVLTDQAISAMAGVADRLDAGQELTESDAALVMACFGPAARELEQWRRKGQLVRDLMGENVLMFPGAR